MEIQPETINEPTTAPVSTTHFETSTDEDGPIIMRVRKRNGSLEPVDVNKIVNVVLACSTGLKEVDPMRVATKVISGLYDGASTAELDQLCIQTASFLIGEEPEYSRLSSRLLARYIDEEVSSQNIRNFYDSVTVGYENGLISKEKYDWVKDHKEPLNIIIDNNRTKKFEYFGLRTVYDRYLLKHPESRKVIETPQYFFLRVACGLARSFEEAKEFYELISTLDYMTSSPTLFNSATLRPQLSSCYLLDSPEDSLLGIYDKYKDVALLSKFAGGIGLSFSKVRSRGSLIKGTNGHSNGLIPWLKTLDSSVAAVNQGGRRKGAACVYLETWHADIEEFLQLRDNTGDEQQRTHNLNLANWVPDLFMKRLEKNAVWSLFDPKKVPHFVNLYGEEFEKAYVKAENEGLFERQINARDLYSRMMKTLAQTGNGWMTFKDASNLKSNQTGKPENVIHLSNLCTEILEVTDSKETAVCNLGSVNAGAHYENGKFNWDKLKNTVKTAVKYLDRVIDINFYPIPSAEVSNNRWRPIGLGLMGLQDLFFKMNISFDSEEAKKISKKISEEIYYYAIETSCELAEIYGAHQAFRETRAAKGELQLDLWGVEPEDKKRWDSLRKRVKDIGLRNSLVIAIAPTATIASICGCYEAIEPQVSNLFKRETLSGEFIQVNKYLVTKLKELGLWNEGLRDKIKTNDGSIQDIDEIPQEVKDVYRTVWEIPQKSLIDMAADRGAFIDQSQSLNLFIESPTIGKLSSMYMYAWKKGVKTTYYLRSRPATKIAKVTTSNNTTKKTYTEAEALACSLENPEVCEACQ
ncbi:MAG: ribonucleoside-diphosphate reductase subunit alpha [Bdellovibrionales bacterium]|nr:ribonucleoside-diphosphate reductase subunit alpha [Bdellovibrionales bacterium]